MGRSMCEVNPVLRRDLRHRPHVRPALAAEFRRAALEESLEAGGRHMDDLLQRGVADIPERMDGPVRDIHRGPHRHRRPFTVLEELRLALDHQEPLVVLFMPMRRRSAARGRFAAEHRVATARLSAGQVKNGPIPEGLKDRGLAGKDDNRSGWRMHRRKIDRNPPPFQLTDSLKSRSFWPRRTLPA